MKGGELQRTESSIVAWPSRGRCIPSGNTEKQGTPGATEALAHQAGDLGVPVWDVASHGTPVPHPVVDGLGKGTHHSQQSFQCAILGPFAALAAPAALAPLAAEMSSATIGFTFAAASRCLRTSEVQQVDRRGVYSARSVTAPGAEGAEAVGTRVGDSMAATTIRAWGCEVPATGLQRCEHVLDAGKLHLGQAFQ